MPKANQPVPKSEPNPRADTPVVVLAVAVIGTEA
jgi:hypothetical protein